MAGGRLFYWDSLEVFLNGTFAGSRYDNTKGVQAGGSLLAQHAPDYLTLATGISILLDTHYDVGAATSAASIITSMPSLGPTGTQTTSFGAWQNSLSGSVLFTNVRGYTKTGGPLGMYLRVAWDQLQHYHNGGLVYSHGAGELDNLYFFAPIGMPFMGMPPRIAAGAAINPTPVLGPTTPGGTTAYDKRWSASSEVSGAYRFKEQGGAVWQAPEVQVALISVPGGSCEDCVATAGQITGSNTASLVCTASTELASTNAVFAEYDCYDCGNGTTAIVPAHYKVWRTALEFTAADCAIMALPNLPKSIKRLAGDYAAWWLRFAMPRTKGAASNQCGWIDPVTVPAIVETHPAQSRIAQRVTNAQAAMEDTFGYSSRAPGHKYGSRFLSAAYAVQTTNPGACPVVPPEVPPGVVVPCYVLPADGTCYNVISSEFPSEVQDIPPALNSNPDLGNYLYHVDADARYVNMWCNPHWAYWYYYPPNRDEGTPIQGYEWPVRGARANPLEYWLPLGQQYGWIPGLPAWDNTRTRTDLLSAPLLEGGMNGAWKTFSGLNHTSPVGICRFTAQQQAPADYTLTSGSSGSWLYTSCTGAQGADIVLTPTPAATTIKAKFDLGQYSRVPYMLGHLAAQFGVDWDATNVTAARVKLESIDGTTVVLIATAPGRYGRIAEADTIYAGTHGQEWGMGLVDDTGVDLLPSGQSASAMASNEGVAALQLLSGLGAKYLVFEFDIASDAVPVTLRYPVLYMSDERAEVLAEARHAQTLLWPFGPAVRYGQNSYWNYLAGTFSDPPTANSPVANQASVLDWLCYRRHWFEGIAATSGLDAELAAVYDSQEGNTREVISGYTNSFLALVRGMPTGFMVNGYREAPPLAVFPVRSRDADMQPTGAFAQESWSHAHEPRLYIAGGSPVHLWSPARALQWTQPYYYQPAGYAIMTHSRPVTNDEETDHLLVCEDTNYARWTPWHGWRGDMAIGPGNGKRLRSPATIHSWDNRYMKASVETTTNNVWFECARFSSPPPFLVQGYATSTGDADNPHMSENGRESVILLYERTGTGNVHEKRTHDQGRTWSSESVAFTGASRPRVVHGNGILHRAAWVAVSGSRGNVVANLIRDGETSPSANFNWKDAAGVDLLIENTGFDLTYSQDSQARWVATFRKWDTGTGAFEAGTSDWCSYDDGRTWVRIT